MFDVITFGSAAWDAYMDLPPKFVKKSAHFTPAKDLVFDLGSKIDIPGTRFAFGGGGVNTARMFAAQGFSTAYCGMVGDDIPGRETVAYLKSLGVDAAMVSKTDTRGTKSTVVLSSPGAARVLLVYSGASDCWRVKHPLGKAERKLFYLRRYRANCAVVTANHASQETRRDRGGNLAIPVAMGRACVKSLLARIDVLILNLEEAAIMTSTDYRDEKNILKKVVHLHPGINVATKGKDGAAIIAGGKIYSAKLKSFKTINATGAGDAFASGFMSGLLASNNDIEYSLKLALAAAKHCLSSRLPEGLPANQNLRLIERESIKIKVRSLCS